MRIGIYAVRQHFLYFVFFGKLNCSILLLIFLLYASLL